MSQVVIEELVDIADCYASPLATFIRMYGVENDLHVLSNFSMDKFVMQEVLYHISRGLLVRVHRKKEEHWSTLPLLIRFYEI